MRRIHGKQADVGVHECPAELVGLEALVSDKRILLPQLALTNCGSRRDSAVIDRCWQTELAQLVQLIFHQSD